MKGLAKWICAIVLFAFCIQGVSAGFTASSVTITPDGDSITSTTPVTASTKIDISNQFTGGSLQLTTDLDKPQWTYSVFVNGVENIRPATGGKTLIINGFELKYKSGDQVSVQATLSGTVPTVTQTGDKTMLKIFETDTGGNVVASTQVIRTKTVINQDSKDALIREARAALQTLRSHIDEMAALDIDTSGGEAKYNEAKQKIDAASALQVTQFKAILANIDAAKASIAAGEKELDKAWAQSEVDKAQGPITQVDAIIGWFRGNSTTANDPQLPVIMAKRENAVNSLSTANDEIASGNYAQARTKAQDAYNKANESYNDALKRQAEAGGFDIFGMIGKIIGSGIMIVAVGLVVVVLVAVGIIVYRKRSRWDELG